MFYTEKVHTMCIRCVFILNRKRVESRVFHTTISQRSCHVQHSTCNQNVAIHSMFNIQECVPTLHRMCVESRVINPTISLRSCHVQHYTCSRNAAGHSIFNIQEFQTAFSTLHWTVSKCILHGKSANRVHTVCSYIARNARWFTGVLSDDIAAILPCTAL